MRVSSFLVRPPILGSTYVIGSLRTLYTYIKNLTSPSVVLTKNVAHPVRNASGKKRWWTYLHLPLFLTPSYDSICFARGGFTRYIFMLPAGDTGIESHIKIYYTSVVKNLRSHSHFQDFIRRR